MVKPYLNQVGGNVDDDVSMFCDGLNTYVNKAFLESNQMPYVMNMELGSAPGIRTRKLRSTLASWMPHNVWSENVGEVEQIFTYDKNHIFMLTEEDSTKHLWHILTYRGQYNLQEYDNLIIPAEDTYYFTIARQATDTYVYVTGTQFKVKITVDETDPPFTSAEPAEDDHYGICCAHKGRLFLADPTTNVITFSALHDYDNFEKPFDQTKTYKVIDMPPPSTPGPDDDYDVNTIYLVSSSDEEWQKFVWDTTDQEWVDDGFMPKKYMLSSGTSGYVLPDYSVIAGDFKVTNAIGKIVSIKSFDDKLVIFCEHSMHVLYGDTPDTSMSNQFQLVDLNNNLGALSDRCVAIGGGRLFWLGDNSEVYEYSGASINMISRPGKTRNSTLSIGAVSGLLDARIGEDTGNSHATFTATAEKLYINIWNAKRPDLPDTTKLLFVFDIYNRTWWCEDGNFNTIGAFENNTNTILLGTTNDVLMNNIEGNVEYGTDIYKDEVYDYHTGEVVEKPIEYEFHTRVYGADGSDLRESLAKVWFQARATADVYINDIWTSRDVWSSPQEVMSNLVKIGSLTYEEQQPTQPTTYRPDTYEQQVCYTQKMYGQRLNTFQIIVKGVGGSVFYLMKRVWRAR